MTEEKPPSDKALLSGMAAMLARRHGARAPALLEQRIRQLEGNGDVLAKALLRGVADELDRMDPSSATH